MNLTLNIIDESNEFDLINHKNIRRLNCELLGVELDVEQFHNDVDEIVLYVEPIVFAIKHKSERFIEQFKKG